MLWVLFSEINFYGWQNYHDRHRSKVPVFILHIPQSHTHFINTLFWDSIYLFSRNRLFFLSESMYDVTQSSLPASCLWWAKAPDLSLFGVLQLLIIKSKSWLSADKVGDDISESLSPQMSYKYYQKLLILWI